MFMLERKILNLDGPFEIKRLETDLSSFDIIFLKM